MTYTSRARLQPPFAPLTHPWPAALLRRLEGFKNWCKRNGRNKPKKGKRTRCRYCDDKRAGVHWTKRNKMGCARLETCIAKKYALRQPSESYLEPSPLRACSPCVD